MNAVIHFMNHKITNKYESFTGLMADDFSQIYLSESRIYNDIRIFMNELMQVQNASNSALSWHTDNEDFEHWIFVLE